MQRHRSMAKRIEIAPENYFGLTDAKELEKIAGGLASLRLMELETGPLWTNFTRAGLMEIHGYVLQDVYPWAGTIRTEEVAAMGIALCRAKYVNDQFNYVCRRIAKHPPSVTDLKSAVRTVADHWGELTAVHPFRDGNSRTQRFFFDQMLRHAGWGIDWQLIDATEVHAARYVAVVTGDAQFLADALLPGAGAIKDIDGPSVGKTQGQADPKQASELFHQMLEFRQSYPRQSFHESIVAGKVPKKDL